MKIEDYIRSWGEPERSVSRLEIEVQLETLLSRRDSYTETEREIAGQLLDILDGVHPDGVYTETEFVENYYDNLIEAPDTHLPEKESYAGFLCDTFRNFYQKVTLGGFEFPHTSDERADNRYESKVYEIWADIGNILKSALGYLDDGVLIGDIMCEARRAKGAAQRIDSVEKKYSLTSGEQKQSLCELLDQVDGVILKIHDKLSEINWWLDNEDIPLDQWTSCYEQLVDELRFLWIKLEEAWEEDFQHFFYVYKENLSPNDFYEIDQARLLRENAIEEMREMAEGL